MKLKMLSTLFAIIMVTGITTSFAADPKASTTPTVYTESNTDISVTAAHPEFTIKLKSNPTTGYTWFLREYSTKMIKPIKHDFEASKTKLIGAPGYETWTFRINPDAFRVPQMLTIRMIYARPWKSNDSATQLVFHITTVTK